MRIGTNRLFPYPVMRESTDFSNYKNSLYRLEIGSASSDKEFYYLNEVKVTIENDQIKELLRQGKIEAYLLVECSSTIFREKFVISEEPSNIKIDIFNLNNNVEVTSFIVAKEDFDFSNDDFLDDYENSTFKIEKGCILAIEQGFNSTIDYSNINDKKVSSIFLIIYDENAEDMKVMVDDSKKIMICLPKKTYDRYNSLKNNDNFYSLFFSIIAIPALTKGLQRIQDRINMDESTIEDEIGSYKWFNTIINAYKKKTNKNITTDDFSEIDVVEVAQIILEHPSSNAIEDLFNLKPFDYGGDDDDE